MRSTVVFAALGVVACLAGPSPAGAEGAPVLVDDINQQLVTYGVRLEGGAEPAIVDVDGTAFFRGCADDGTTGCELWKSDGTSGGTALVKDIVVGTASSGPSYLTNVGGTLFFTADDGTHGRELWKSDGTEAGTLLVKDINPGSGSSDPGALTAVNGTLFFVGPGGLWKSDGTAAGTERVATIVASSTVTWETGTLSGIAPYVAGPAGGIFTLDPGVAEVPGVDYGGTAGTWSATICCGEQTGTFSSTFSGGNVVFGTASGAYALAGYPAPGVDLTVSGPATFSASPALPDTLEDLRFEATLTVTAALTDSYAFSGPFRLTATADSIPGVLTGTPQQLTNVEGTLFFTVRKQLWESDGTAAGTALVKDIPPLSGGAGPNELTNVNGTLFFTAYDETGGRELWKSDGTESGTLLVADIGPGNELAAVNGLLFFVACSAGGYPDGDCELWKSDGTAGGTVRVKDILPGSGSSLPSELTNVNGTLFFRACSAYNYGPADCELWRSDGSAAGTFRVKDIVPGLGDPGIDGLTNVDGTLFFAGYDWASGADGLWKSNGTAAGTVLVQHVDYVWHPPGRWFTDVNGMLFFAAADGGTYRLWRSDGTADGTFVAMEDRPPGTASSFPSSLTDVNGTLFFSATGGLWKSNGTEAGTVFVRSVGGEGLTNVNGTLFFTFGLELWKSDGTAAGTILVKDVPPMEGEGPSELTSLTNADGRLFFLSCTSYYVTSCELWTSDGTGAGTALVSRDLVLLWPPELASVSRTLFFPACSYSYECGLWKSDGTAAGTLLVKEDVGFVFGSAELTNVNGTLFFVGSGGLWKSDGTEAGTVLVKDVAAQDLTNVNGTLFFIGPGGLWKSDATEGGTVLVKGVAAQELTNVNGTLFFVGSDDAHGSELWKSDGTTAGTVLVKDVRPGSSSSSPAELTNGNGTLYFTANDGTSGEELWQSDGTEAGTRLVTDLIPGSGGSVPKELTTVGSWLFFSAIGENIGRELWVLPIPEPDVRLLGLAGVGALAVLAQRRRAHALTRRSCPRCAG